MFAYSTSNRCDRNAQFFVDFSGMERMVDTLFLFVVNGETMNFMVPSLPNVIVIKRPNVGWDFGGHAAGITEVRRLLGDLMGPASPTFYGFVNCGMTGPLLPSYVPPEFDWFSAFSNRLDDNVKLVGTYITCLPADDVSGTGARVEGHSFFTDRIGLKILLDAGVFSEHREFPDAVKDGEWAMTPAIFAAGYTIDTLLYKYQGVDWRDERNWLCNDRKFAGRPGEYDGINISPFETIFFKAFWGNLPVGHQAVNLGETLRYMKWRRQWSDGTGALPESGEKK